MFFSVVTVVGARRSRGRRLQRFQRNTIVAADQRGLAVRRQPIVPVIVVGCAFAADLAVLPTLVVFNVQNGHFYALAARGAPLAVFRQRGYPQAVRRVHSDVRPGHAVRVQNVVIVIIHFQVGHVVPVYARIRAARQRVLPTTHPTRRFLVQSGRRLRYLESRFYDNISGAMLLLPMQPVPLCEGIMAVAKSHFRGWGKSAF